MVELLDNPSRCQTNARLRSSTRTKAFDS